MQADDDCFILDLACKGKEVVGAALGGALEDAANAVIEGVGKILASIGSIWVFLPTPNVTSGDGVEAADPGGMALPITIILNRIMWIGLVICIIAIIAFAVTMMFRSRQGEGEQTIGRLGMVLIAVVVISASASLVTGLLPGGPTGVGGAAGFIQASTWYIMIAVAVGSTIVGAARMAITMRGDAGRDLFFGLLKLIFASGAAVGFIGLAILAADYYSVWVIDRATDCDMPNDDTCFGRNVGQMFVGLSTSTLGTILVIVLGCIALLLAFGQIVLMIARSAMLVVMTGMLPLSAAAGMSGESGRSWLSRNISWLLAFLLYKPVAATIYAAAFYMTGADLFKDDGSGLITIITGLMMLLLALVALPALMKFVTPMVGQMANGASSTTLMAAALPMGAAGMGRLFGNGGGDGGGGGGGAPPSGSVPNGPTGGDDPPDPDGGSGSGTPPPPPTPPPSSASPGAAGTEAGAGAGAGAGATSGATAGAAGGPWVAAAGAAAGAIKEAGEQVQSTAQSVASDSTGDGPSGSNNG